MRAADLLRQVPYLDDMLRARDAADAPGWFVGGCVRDLLLGRLPADYDLATPQAERLARALADRDGAALVPMDIPRGIWRVVMPDGVIVDCCALRDADILGDLRGRDFTMNALALRLPGADTPAGLFDPFRGRDDLAANVLRVVTPAAFLDDPVRVLRAFRFLAELPLSLADDTATHLDDAVEHLTRSAPERLLAEWWKLCAGPHAARALRAMDHHGALRVLLPEVQAMKGVTQNAYHHLDVFEHAMLATVNMTELLRQPAAWLEDLAPDFAPVLNAPRRRARLVALALLHDIGKPHTRSVREHAVHFYGHERAGANMVRDVAARLRVSRDDTRAMTTIVREHLRPLHLMHARARGQLGIKGMMNFFAATGEYAWEVMLLALADKQASRGPAAEADTLDQLRDLYRALLAFFHDAYAPAHAAPLLTGTDLNALGMPAGPAMGDLLRQARLMQMHGQLTNRADAISWARHRIGGR